MEQPQNFTLDHRERRQESDWAMVVEKVATRAQKTGALCPARTHAVFLLRRVEMVVDE